MKPKWCFGFESAFQYLTNMRLLWHFNRFIILFSILTFLHIIIAVCQNSFFDYMRNQNTSSNQVSGRIRILENVLSYNQHEDIVHQYYRSRQTWVTSNLGTYMFKNIDHGKMNRLGRENRLFRVMIWQHWEWLKLRHAERSTPFGSGSMLDCSVSNCIFSGDPDFHTADAVVVHLQKGVFPRVARRNPQQIWIFLSDESPLNTFSLSKNRIRLTQLVDIFNWSMTYRSDSDIPVPYGRTIPLPYPRLNNVSSAKLADLIPYWPIKRRDVLASILISNCFVSSRMDYLKELKKYMKIDVHGKCATNEKFKDSCPGYFGKDCNVTSEYLFYLVFENSRCRQYLTEKIFQHAYGKGAIPVIMGPPVEDCEKLLPPNSFLHVDNFQTLDHLASEMFVISRNLTRLLSYHAWRNHFEAVDEHGYFDKKSYHLCRICEALNYNDESPKVYSLMDILLYLDPYTLCKNN